MCALTKCLIKSHSILYDSIEMTALLEICHSNLLTQQNMSDSIHKCFTSMTDSLRCAHLILTDLSEETENWLLCLQSWFPESNHVRLCNYSTDRQTDSRSENRSKVKKRAIVRHSLNRVCALTKHLVESHSTLYDSIEMTALLEICHSDLLAQWDVSNPIHKHFTRTNCRVRDRVRDCNHLCLHYCCY